MVPQIGALVRHGLERQAAISALVRHGLENQAAVGALYPEMFEQHAEVRSVRRDEFDPKRGVGPLRRQELDRHPSIGSDDCARGEQFPASNIPLAGRRPCRTGDVSGAVGAVRGTGTPQIRAHFLAPIR